MINIKKLLLSQLFILTIICSSLSIDIFGQNTLLTKVDTIVNITHPQEDLSKNLKLNIGDYIYVQISNVSRSLAQGSSIDKNKFILYFDAWAMNGIKPDKIMFVDTFHVGLKIRLFYKINRDAQSYEAWSYFFQYPLAISDRTMTLDIGYNDNQPFNSDKKINLVLINKSNFFVTIILIISLFLFLIVLAATTNLLKNPSSDNSPACYSLAKTQLAFWNFIIAAMALYIWTITGDCPYLSQTALILIGISTITIAGSKFVDKIQAPDNKYPPDPGAVNNQTVVNTRKGKTTFVSQVYKFIMDILSDSNGLSINRVQMVLWSLIIFIFLLQDVVKTLVFPELPDSLLVLTGISNGTYVLLKTQEK
jgi:hypothetical protein